VAGQAAMRRHKRSRKRRTGTPVGAAYRRRAAMGAPDADVR
jgi:hypothetical protein